MTRICRDCQYHDPMTHLCLHSRSEQADIVTGEMNRQTCYQMRIWPCGGEGRFWQPLPDVIENDPVESTAPF